MKALKIIIVLLLVYVGIVVAFETWLGYSQPAGATTLVITTLDDDGNPHDRVVSRLTSNDALYVAANHWPRAWYHQAIENPHVEVTQNGETLPYLAVPATAEEHDRVVGENPHGIVFKLLTGFPPRYFLRLDPAPQVPAATG
ncbi:MAG: nitroreductase family deazaflavin-dependent oxidoreductase [Gammaproteobacteria bacterium]|nr:nitroreductase family deazaflavin-dependent oxidoreductase [Gammaproteobacteria bacterium]